MLISQENCHYIKFSNLEENNTFICKCKFVEKMNDIVIMKMKYKIYSKIC